MIYDEIALKLKELIDGKDLNISELSKIAKVQISNMSNFLKRNQMSISLEAVYNICNYFDISLDDFLNIKMSDILSKCGEDKTYKCITNWIEIQWQKWDYKEKIWFDIQFQKAFSEYNKWVEENKIISNVKKEVKPDKKSQAG